MDKGQQLQLLELVKDVPFFKGFTLEEKRSLSSGDCEVVRYHTGEEIIVEGGTDNFLYIILRGEVGVTKNTPSPVPKIKSRKTLVAKLSPGAVFGEIALISERPRTTGVHAIGEVIALKMNGDMIEKMEPTFRNKVQALLINLLVKRLDDMNNQITDTAR